MSGTKVLKLQRSQQNLLQEMKNRHQIELRTAIIDILCELGLKEQIQAGKEWRADFTPDSSSVEFVSIESPALTFMPIVDTTKNKKPN